MILADTSVWVEAERRPHGRTAATFRALIDSDDLLLALPVRLELLAAVASARRKAFLRALTALPVVRPTDETWRIVESWIAAAADRGHWFALTNLVVAALAQEVDALVWSLDSDFARMEQLGLARLYE